MVSTLTEPKMGVGFGRGCEGAIVDGAGREGVAAVKPVAEPPQNGDAQQSGGDLVSPDLQIEKPVTGLMGVLCKRETLFRAWRKVRERIIPLSQVACGGRLRRAREGIEWLRAIGVSTVPRGPKGRRTATGMLTSGSRHPKTGNPAPFQISPATPIC